MDHDDDDDGDDDVDGDGSGGDDEHHNNQINLVQWSCPARSMMMLKMLNPMSSMPVSEKMPCHDDNDDQDDVDGDDAMQAVPGTGGKEEGGESLTREEMQEQERLRWGEVRSRRGSDGWSGCSCWLWHGEEGKGCDDDDHVDAIIMNLEKEMVDKMQSRMM